MSFLDVNRDTSFRDGIAYTEDDIRVHKLLVRMISCTTTDQQLLAYFSQFGEVVKMCPKNGHLEHILKSFTIHYADAQVAAKVLQMPNHLIHKKTIVTACQSWEQPDAFKSNDDEISDNLGATTSQRAPPLNMLGLNDDCLEHVAKFLKLEYQLHMARTCIRFSGALEMLFRVEHKSIYLIDLKKLKLWDIREFFLMAGTNAQNLVGVLPKKYYRQIAELIGNNCPKVEYLNLSSSKFEEYTFRRLIKNMHNITRLYLNQCCLTDKELRVIQELPKLETMSLSSNYALTGKYISKQTTVRTLSLDRCIKLTTGNFIDIISSMKELNDLDIEYCRKLGRIAFLAMAKHCQNLVVLRMSCPPTPRGLYWIASLPSLKRLKLTGGRRGVNDSFFFSLTLYNSWQLENLVITARNCINAKSSTYLAKFSRLKQLVLGRNKDLDDNCLYQFGKLTQLEEIGVLDCGNITKNGLLLLMRQCTKLRTVNVQYCSQINDEFIFDVIELLAERQKRRPMLPNQRPVLIYVNGSAVSRFVMQDALCQNASTLIEVSYSMVYTKKSLCHCFEDQYDVYDNDSDGNYDDNDTDDE